MGARLALLLAAALLGGPAAAATLRVTFPFAETSFDPAQVADLYSRTVIAGIFEAPLEYEYLARPLRLRPNTAVALPEVSADFRSVTFRIRPGIHFADHPAFGGRPRELVAADYVYSLKRHADPRWKGAHFELLADVEGLAALRQRCLDAKQPFDYERPVAGLQVLARYSFRVRLAHPQPRFAGLFADPSFAGAVAREVVEAHGDAVGEHPVGTGPFRLAEWQRSLRIVLERSPSYREVRYDERPPPGETQLLAAAQRLQGRRLPLPDRVQIDIIEQPQARWLSFLNAEHELIENTPVDYIDVAPRRLQRWRYARPSIAFTYFAMGHPLVGGNAPAQVALRRAIALAVDVPREIRLVRRSQAVPAQSAVAPGVYGHDATFRSEMGSYDLARSRALLDVYGYIDRDGDGWREQPDGQPLTLEVATQPDALSRQLAEQWQRNMKALGLRIEFQVASWPENAKRSRAGGLMVWSLGWLAGQPDADTFLALGYGPQAGAGNPSRFALPAYDALYERQRSLPDGPERLAAIRAAQKLLIAYMPMKVHVHHVSTDMAQRWVEGYCPNVFVPAFWKYVAVGPHRAHAGAPPE